METDTIAEQVKELHGDLSQKWRLHAASIRNMWRSFNAEQRKNCLKAVAADGHVLEHSLDESMGDVYKFIPEWNLRDITEPDSDFLIDLVEYRATTSLLEQYRAGFDGRAGDYALIDEMIHTRSLRHIEPFKNWYTWFDDERYARSFEIVSGHTNILARIQPLILAGLCIPRSTGELILLRQNCLLQSLNTVIEEILNQGSQSRCKGSLPKERTTRLYSALSGLTIEDEPKKLNLSELSDQCSEHKDTVEEFLDLLRTQPIVLTHEVKVRFFNRPEFIADEKGRRLPVQTDKFLSIVFFEAIHTATQITSIWNYISHLFEILEISTPNRNCRAVVLQELRNVCQLEFRRAQALFKRHVQSHRGAKWFKRISNVFEANGNARVSMKGSPESLTRTDPQLHYMLRLCQLETDVSDAFKWLQKLGNLHERYTDQLGQLDQGEIDSLGDLGIIVGLLQELSLVVSMPPTSHQKGQIFVSGYKRHEAELSLLKEELDLRDLVTPIDNLLEPGVSVKAIEALDRFTVEKASADMGRLYQDFSEDCVSQVQEQCQRMIANVQQEERTQWSQLSVSVIKPAEEEPRQKKPKPKSRPLQSSAYDLRLVPEKAPTEDTERPSQTFKVTSSTAAVFSTLFEKSEARGSVDWDAFKNAMTALGFSTLPKFGSVFTFSPPDSMEAARSLTVHRPHGSQIEGYRILILARRLKRLYGWDKNTFELAQV